MARSEKQKSIADRWAWLAGLPPVNFKMLYLCVLDALTFFATWLLMAWIVFYVPTARLVLIDGLITFILGSWYTFLAGLHGINLAAYWKKRGTSDDNNFDEDKGARDARKADVQAPAPSPDAHFPAAKVEDPISGLGLLAKAGARPVLTDHDEGVL